jgi:hypothetical protein
MKKIIICVVSVLVLSTQAFAHSGRTDKNGGHNCSQKSIDKGLCTGYHYHNGKSYANNAKGHEGHEGHENHHDHKAIELTKSEVKSNT